MKKPQRPLPTDCCGSGCTRCVYDLYEDQKIQYEMWKKEQQQDEEKPNQ
ncbi:oxidoreductase-like domain-containing protein [Fodinibius roseus]|nr:oxidoreductase-like domain-containing protein [Fodinibius roseus]